MDSRHYALLPRAAIGICIVTCVLFLAPERAFADSRGLVISAGAFVVGQALDVHSTYQARSSGNGVEGNSLMDVSTGQQVAIKAGTATAVVLLARVIHRQHPRMAKAVLLTGSALTFTVAARNYSIARR